ncbi:hypothetical protein [Amycolatopsis australiensis]|uniref:Excreted virulence factor EspC, type VII ESX diderm n=1 Tax=Amycolatopsis australiensis TaxID=546364 RepID=A0A1K1SJH9_9PSEU|nr:hypothetical protein [Amycolatopsis australiensis]SFW84470.1 Excreted virulence factor EspC, type VII ESX diderm [Amycolatopsis australiensis]
MSGFHADPAALDALALRLEDTADEYSAAAAEAEAAASGDVGPVVDALAALAAEWSGRIRAVERDVTTAAAGVRTAANAYRETDIAAADELGRADD